MKPSPDISKFPTEFRGCMWNDGWEFEAPCVIYYPAKYAAFKSACNTGGIEELVEDICMNLSLGWDHNDHGLSGEREWRGWGKRFSRRRNAWHVTIKIRWELGEEGEAEWHQISCTENFGLTNPTP